MSRIVVFLAILFHSIFINTALAANFLSTPAEPIRAEQAFQPQARIDNDTLVVTWSIAPGTYLYRKAFAFESAQATLGEARTPEAVIIEDPYYGQTAIYRDNVQITVPLLAVQQRDIHVKVAYQGCSDLGFCYPPQETSFDLTMPLADGSLAPQDRASNVLQDQPMAVALLSFFGFGLLLAFTPCVLPMIPILSALILDEQRKHHRLHAFKMALTYVLAMASTYAGLGAVVARLGSLFQAQLQSPWVLSATAAILILMACWIIYDHRFTFLTRGNHPLHKISQALPRGEYIGVALMGIIASLVVSPCVTAPLVGAFSYIALSGDVLLGAAALFCLGLGMGVPLIAVTWGGTALLPKHGRWMRVIKWLFAAMLVVMAFSLVARFIPNPFDDQRKSSLPFTYIRSSLELDQALAQSKVQGEVVMLDFYADWCRSCVAMEHTLFQDPQVLSQLSKVKLLKVDVTDYNAELNALQRQWQVYGPPALLFFNAQGQPVPGLRIVGEVSEPCFIAHLEALNNEKKSANCSD